MFSLLHTLGSNTILVGINWWERGKREGTKRSRGNLNEMKTEKGRGELREG